MKNKLITSLLGLFAVGLAASASRGQTITGNTFNDPLTSANTTYWNYGSASYAPTFSGAGIALSEPTNATGAESISLNLPSGDGGLPNAIPGDFSLQVSFANLSAMGSVDLDIGTGDNSFDLWYLGYLGSYDVEWINNIFGSSTSGTLADPSANSGTFNITATGSTLNVSVDGALLFTDSYGSPLSQVSLDVGSVNNYPVTATFSDFSLTGAGIQATATPEPNTIALAGLGGVAFAARLRRRK